MKPIIIIMLIGSLGAQAQMKSLLPNSSSLLFEENKGQIIDENGKIQHDVLFVVRATKMTVFFRKHSISYQWHANINNTKPADHISEATLMPVADIQDTFVTLQTFRVDMIWEDASKDVRLIASDPSNGYSNFYLNHCPHGITDVRSYKTLLYQDLYSGVDVTFYINEKGNLKYDVLSDTGNNLSNFHFSYRGTTPVIVDGKIRIDTPLGYLEEQQPVAWIADSPQSKVDARYTRTGDGFGFTLKKTTSSLVIDPEIIWATYYGGTASDIGYATTIDTSGDVFLTGSTASTTAIAASPGCITTRGSSGTDAFIVKLSSDGTTRRWATYYGAAGDDAALAIAPDHEGNIFIAGTTEGPTLPGATYINSYRGGNRDAFLAKFANTGACSWATFYGSGGVDYAYAVAVDATGNVYLAGSCSDAVGDITDSATGHDKTYDNPQFSYQADAFVVKFNNTGTTRFWATYYGDEFTDEATGIAITEQGDVIVVGTTSSDTEIATPGAFKTTRTARDGFIVKFGANGTRQWGTYTGGAGDDDVTAVTLDNDGDIYLTGNTYSTADFATPGAYQTQKSGNLTWDAFASKFSSSGSQQWATYFGGPSNDYGRSIAVDGMNHVFIVGETMSTSGIAFNGIDNDFSGNYDSFLAMIDPDGAGLRWSTYYGGTNNDYARSIVKDVSGVYIAGNTASTGLSKLGFQSNYAAGGSDAFLAKLGVREIVSMSSPALAGKNASTPVSVTLNYAANAVIKFWSRGISGAKENWNVETLTPDENTATKNLVSSTLTDPIGIVYYFEITDGLDVITSETKTTHLSFENGENSIPGLRFGNQVSDYQIISIPLVLDDKNVSSVLDELIPYDRKRWRFFSYYENDNREYPGFPDIKPGLGYWLISKNQTTILLGKGTTVIADDARPFITTLKQGWNLIGNPFNFRISWQDVLDHNNNPEGVGDLNLFTGSALTSGDVLDAYRGAFVFSDEDMDIEIPVLRNTALGSGRKKPGRNSRISLDKDEWILPLTLTAPGQQFTNEVGSVGMHPNATQTGKDRFDRVSVPLLKGLGFVEMNVDHPEISATFSRDVVPTNENYIWSINIVNDAMAPLEMQWNNDLIDDSEKQLYFFDHTIRQAINMREQASMKLSPDITNVSLLFGDQVYIDAFLDDNVPLVGYPYPTPADGDVFIPFRIAGEDAKQEVSVVIADAAGREVYSEIIQMSKGANVFRWIPELPGFYIVRVAAGGKIFSRKIIVR